MAKPSPTPVHSFEILPRHDGLAGALTPETALNWLRGEYDDWETIASWGMTSDDASMRGACALLAANVSHMVTTCAEAIAHRRPVRIERQHEIDEAATLGHLLRAALGAAKDWEGLGPAVAALAMALGRSADRDALTPERRRGRKAA